ncbi:lytic polysaccharide monooxygenase [Catenuloplanes indicus]|uniref:lytic polysaccharide monooxygenase n=1 Tax=Catenuloplanes indicus TaxID=137267 RepID=UPI003522D47A
MVNFRRRAAAYFAASVLAAGLVTVISPPSAAQAHGAMMRPGSRTYLCWQDGMDSTGQIVPQNSACRAATNISGTNVLYNWFSVLRSDGAGRMEGFIPDGQLCSGGNTNFTGFNVPGDWPVTHLTSGAAWSWRYSNWAHHPGTFSMYITNDGWDPNQPLAWDDLADTPFLQVTNPPQNGPVGSNDGHYYWSGNLPSGKSGRHIIYSVWSRSDSQETFYGCSDVVFDGGNGEVTGLKGGGTVTPTPTPTSSPSPRPTTPGPTTPAPTTPPPTTGHPGNGCMAVYSVVSTWNGGMQGQVEIMNHNTATSGGWTATLTLPSTYTISSLWNGTMSGSGSTVTVRNVNWNGAIAPERSTTFGFVANGSGLPQVSCTLS